MLFCRELPRGLTVVAGIARAVATVGISLERAWGSVREAGGGKCIKIVEACGNPTVGNTDALAMVVLEGEGCGRSQLMCLADGLEWVTGAEVIRPTWIEPKASGSCRLGSCELALLAEDAGLGLAWTEFS